MESRAIDRDDFRQAQHKNWDSAAVGWNEWSEFNDRADRHISERLVGLAEVQPGSKVLDVAAGYGEPALTAARKAGPKGRVVATDISPEMLAFGRERTAVAGLANIEFIESDASRLKFPPESFDAAVSRWGSSSSLTPRPPRGASEASSSRAHGWRSAPGASPIRSPSSRSR